MTFSEECILCSSVWRFVIEVLPLLAIEKIELHTVHLTTLVSPNLTSYIKGNSTFNESLKLHFCFFENILCYMEDHILVVLSTTGWGDMQ
jgi:hypothetical protein